MFGRTRDGVAVPIGRVAVSPVSIVAGILQSADLFLRLLILSTHGAADSDSTRIDRPP